MLATRCDALLAADIVEEPLHTASTLSGPAVDPLCTPAFPAEWPDGRFDLIVLSEVLYFLTFRDIAAVAARALTALDTDGVVLSVYWRGHGEDPCGGDEAATILLNRLSSAACRIPLPYC